MRTAEAPTRRSTNWLRSDSLYPGSCLPFNTVAWFVLCGMCVMTAIMCWARTGSAWQSGSIQGIILGVLACISFICGSMTWPGEFSQRPYLPPAQAQQRGEAVDWWSVNSTLNIALLLIVSGQLVAAALFAGSNLAGAAPAGLSLALYLGAFLAAALAEGIWQIVQVVQLAEAAILKGPSLEEQLSDTVVWSSLYDERPSYSAAAARSRRGTAATVGVASSPAGSSRTYDASNFAAAGAASAINSGVTAGKI